MLCEIKEAGKVCYKLACAVNRLCLCMLQDVCYPYWPRSGSQTFGEFTIELMDEENLAGFAVRSFGVYNSKV